MIDKLIISPFAKFATIESLSGILLFVATVLGIAIANSPLSDQYFMFWDYEIGFASEHLDLVKPLHLWVNDGLMTLFFFLIGLEIKRELFIGELNSVRKASLPFLAAIGGILLPVTIFIVTNPNPETANAWGISMATDIAFSLAILKLLGKRIPIGLKVFLTAFAIADDLGAVLAIAVFYSSGIKWLLVVLALTPIIILFVLSAFKFYSKYLVLIMGIISWLLLLKSGIHPTIAGVLVAFTIPIRQSVNLKTYATKLDEIVNELHQSSLKSEPILSKKQIEQIDDLEDWTCKVQSPLQHLEHRLHNWVAYLVIPLFAFANAGLKFSGNATMDYALIGTIVLSLFAGKTIGVSLFSYLGVKFRLADLPEGVSFRQLFGVAMLAGVGFTMSIFIANLAFGSETHYLESAKAGILLGSIISGLAGYLMLLSKNNSK